MRCVKCQSLDDKVIDSRTSREGDLIRRRRECLRCGYRFTTYEQLEQSELRVEKRDGRRESFSRVKLLSGFLKACEKRPVPIEVLEAAADEIIAELAYEERKEVATRRIGLLVMKHLKEIDSVAYVRYASVYRQFEDVGEFLDEIEMLARQRREDPSQGELFAPGPRQPLCERNATFPLAPS